MTTPVHNSLRVYILASGAIAVDTLAALVESPTTDVVGCTTQPDRPQGRRRQLAPTAIGRWCHEHGIDADKPTSINHPDAVARIASTAPDMVLVFAYGQLLRQPLLNIGRFGCVNIHASLLPRHRGAAPVNAAILSGDTVTGISFMKMELGLDTGPVFDHVTLPLTGHETAGELEVRLGRLAAANVCAALHAIANETVTPRSQCAEHATYARKINKDDGRIDWSNPAATIERQVRAFNPWPGAWFELRSRKGLRRVTITAAKVVPSTDIKHAAPGTVVHADKREWCIACGIDSLGVERVLPEGRREMSASEFLRGSPLEVGSTISNETDSHQSRVPRNAHCPS